MKDKGLDQYTVILQLEQHAVLQQGDMLSTTAGERAVNVSNVSEVRMAELLTAVDAVVSKCTHEVGHIVWDYQAKLAVAKELAVVRTMPTLRDAGRPRPAAAPFAAAAERHVRGRSALMQRRDPKLSIPVILDTISGMDWSLHGAAPVMMGTCSAAAAGSGLIRCLTQTVT